MCGILGATSVKDEHPLIRGLESFAYRGPDHTGYSKVDGVFLGNNRLAVIDIDTRSNQPIQSTATTNRIVFNGEIYNYKSLRQSLVDGGCVFTTESDTEVILNGYEKHGLAFFSKLNGMFAFAIHDVSLQEIVLCRDSAGIKPLLYTLLDNKLCFASEIKGITSAYKGRNWELDAEAIDLLFGYGVIPSPITLYKDIRKLEAGAVMRFSLLKKEVISIDYLNPPKEPSVSEVDLEARLKTATQSQLVSDVPVGLFFSGGIDSSLLAAFLHAENVNLKAFSLHIEQKEGDIEYSKKIAEHLGLDVEYIPFGVEEFESSFKEIEGNIDEPTLDSSLFGLYYLSKRAGEKVTVVLSGEGADELFYGYQRQLTIARMHPFFLADRVVNYVYNRVPHFRGRHRFFDLLYSNFSSQYSYYLFSTGFRRNAKNWSRWYRWFDDNSVSHKCIDERLYLENDLLRKIDFATSYSSIEGRVPFLDQSLLGQVNFHQERSVETGESKVSLKNILSKYLPKNLVYRPKSGMGLPMTKIFKESEHIKELWNETQNYLLSESSFAVYHNDIKSASPSKEPYFCYTLITLHLSIKNNNHHVR